MPILFGKRQVIGDKNIQNGKSKKIKAMNLSGF